MQADNVYKKLVAILATHPKIEFWRPSFVQEDIRLPKSDAMICLHRSSPSTELKVTVEKVR